jgi:hypothetical protein
VSLDSSARLSLGTARAEIPPLFGWANEGGGTGQLWLSEVGSAYANPDIGVTNSPSNQRDGMVMIYKYLVGLATGKHAPLKRIYYYNYQNNSRDAKDSGLVSAGSPDPTCGFAVRPAWYYLTAASSAAASSSAFLTDGFFNSVLGWTEPSESPVC